MAKRKRLTPPDPVHLQQGTAPDAGGLLDSSVRSAPIADVARDASQAAFAGEMAETLTRARESGRMVLELTLDQIQLDYLVRDRLAMEDGELSALMASLRQRGQQTPIEVAEIAPGRYGLISGWRRCQALKRLQAETGEAAFQTVLALQRNPAQASEAYLAMVEENEIRVGLSYYERARIAAKAVEQGVFKTERAALRHLYHAASRTKRSKIGSFLTIVHALDGALQFPEALPERAGLRLVRALDEDKGLAIRLRDRLEKARPETAEAEQACLMAELAAQSAKEGKPLSSAPSVTKPALAPKEALGDGLWLRENDDGSLTLGGPALTAAARAQLRRWLAETM
ncbi:ParB/RepB/Spo0J family partition protein [Roseovarius lutimaris]|uniref:ParB/RepB/Spo0J family partition protein n=1 Tax=Roseovarius lutimaris TaxID=1005928 RepID=A0A1I5GDP0_9RHOB|nr:ParB N-terminal domain-containing protein [Roseovarius lutimaris]SFO34208.1 ParB/RepB/Spo0J family partition protein [Roseovarius lutimaris]